MKNNEGNIELEKLYQEYARTVFKYLLCLSKDENLAEDLMQETFYRAIKSFYTFNNECKISVWLCQIAKNLYYKERKRKSNKRSEVLESISENKENNINIEEAIISNDNKISIYKKIHNLSQVSKEIIYLRLSGELSFKEIGEIFNKNETWARVNFYRAKQKLKEENENEKWNMFND